MQADVHNRGTTRIRKGKMIWHLLTDMDNQFVTFLDVFPPARVLEKAEKNMVALIKMPELTPCESFSPTAILRIDTISRDWLLEPQATPEEEIKQNRGMFCAIQKYWEYGDPLVQKLSERIAEKANTDEAYARLAFKTVREHLKLKTHLDERVGAARATVTKEGDCDEHADLFIALNRAVKIPSRRVVGHFYRSGSEPEPHAWCEVYLLNIGWIPVDAALGRFGSLSERYFSRVREGLVSARPTIQVKWDAPATGGPVVEEKVRMSVFKNDRS